MARRDGNGWWLAFGIIAAAVGFGLAADNADKKKREIEAAERARREREAKQAAEAAQREAEAAADRVRCELEAEAKARAIRDFADKTLTVVCALFQIRRPPLHVGPEVDNFASDGVRILVNPRWAIDVIEKHCSSHTCNRDVLRWFIAHEVCHHVNGDAHTPLWIRAEKEQNHLRELRADYFAGYALACLDGDVEHLDSILREHARIDSHTHPDFSKRMRAAREGFWAARPVART